MGILTKILGFFTIVGIIVGIIGIFLLATQGFSLINISLFLGGFAVGVLSGFGYLKLKIATKGMA